MAMKILAVLFLINVVLAAALPVDIVAETSLAANAAERDGVVAIPKPAVERVDDASSADGPTTEDIETTTDSPTAAKDMEASEFFWPSYSYYTPYSYWYRPYSYYYVRPRYYWSSYWW